MKSKGFREFMLISLLALGMGLAALWMVIREAELKQEDRLQEVGEISDSDEMGVLEKELEDTTVEFPEEELGELESAAASL